MKTYQETCTGMRIPIQTNIWRCYCPVTRYSIHHRNATGRADRDDTKRHLIVSPRQLGKEHFRIQDEQADQPFPRPRHTVPQHTTEQLKMVLAVQQHVRGAEQQWKTLCRASISRYKALHGGHLMHVRIIAPTLRSSSCCLCLPLSTWSSRPSGVNQIDGRKQGKASGQGWGGGGGRGRGTWVSTSRRRSTGRSWGHPHRLDALAGGLVGPEDSRIGEDYWPAKSAPRDPSGRRYALPPPSVAPPPWSQRPKLFHGP
jgi:hypothetical protein